MRRDVALEMAEAFSTDCMNGFSSLGSDAEPIVEECWGEISDLRREIERLGFECVKLKNELAASHK